MLEIKSRYLTWGGPKKELSGGLMIKKKTHPVFTSLTHFDTPKYVSMYIVHSYVLTWSLLKPNISTSSAVASALMYN